MSDKIQDEFELYVEQLERTRELVTPKETFNYSYDKGYQAGRAYERKRILEIVTKQLMQYPEWVSKFSKDSFLKDITATIKEPNPE